MKEMKKHSKQILNNKTTKQQQRQHKQQKRNRTTKRKTKTKTTTTTTTTTTKSFIKKYRLHITYIICFIWCIFFDLKEFNKLFSSSLFENNHYDFDTSIIDIPYHHHGGQQRQQQQQKLLNSDNNNNNNSSSSTATTVIKMNENSSSSSTATLPKDQNAPFYFAACLIVKDDNIFLPEWLAFHYAKLPLRRLILGVDVYNRVPLDYLQKAYEKYTSSSSSSSSSTTSSNNNPNSNNSILNITLIQLSKDENMTKDEAVKRNNKRNRQQTLYKHCLDTFKEEGWTWTMFIDSDEFLTLNKYNHILERNECMKRHKNQHKCDNNILKQWKRQRDQLPSMNKDVTKDDSTLAHVINYLNTSKFPTEDSNTFNNHHCIYISRSLYGPKNSTYNEISNNVPTKFNPYNFKTLRDRYHEGIFNRHLGKSIVDVSRYDGIHRPKGPHRILSFRNCTNHFIPYFRIQHYTGTKDEYLFRPGQTYTRNINEYITRTSFETMNFITNDDNKTIDDGIKNYNGGDDDSRYWLSHFVQLVGEIGAYELTEGLQLYAKGQYKNLQ